jgi:hypothetical protein
MSAARYAQLLVPMLWLGMVVAISFLGVSLATERIWSPVGGAPVVQAAGERRGRCPWRRFRSDSMSKW